MGTSIYDRSKNSSQYLAASFAFCKSGGGRDFDFARASFAGQRGDGYFYAWKDPAFAGGYICGAGNVCQLSHLCEHRARGRLASCCF